MPGYNVIHKTYNILYCHQRKSETDMGKMFRKCCCCCCCLTCFQICQWTHRQRNRHTYRHIHNDRRLQYFTPQWEASKEDIWLSVQTCNERQLEYAGSSPSWQIVPPGHLTLMQQTCLSCGLMVMSQNLQTATQCTKTRVRSEWSNQQT